MADFFAGAENTVRTFLYDLFFFRSPRNHIFVCLLLDVSTLHREFLQQFSASPIFWIKFFQVNRKKTFFFSR